MGRKKIEKDYNSVFATNLRSVMREKKITQQEIADVIGISRQAVSQYQDGSTLPNIETLCKIANFLNVSSDFLLGLTDVKSQDMNVRTICEYTGLSEKALEVLVHKTTYNVNSVVDVLLLNEHIGNINRNGILSKIAQYINFDVEGFCDKYVPAHIEGSIDKALYTGFNLNDFSVSLDTYLRSEIARGILDLKQRAPMVVSSHNDVMKNIDDYIFEDEEAFLASNDITNCEG